MDNFLDTKKLQNIFFIFLFIRFIWWETWKKLFIVQSPGLVVRSDDHMFIQYILGSNRAVNWMGHGVNFHIVTCVLLTLNMVLQSQRLWHEKHDENLQAKGKTGIYKWNLFTNKIDPWNLKWNLQAKFKTWNYNYNLIWVSFMKTLQFEITNGIYFCNF